MTQGRVDQFLDRPGARVSAPVVLGRNVAPVHLERNRLWQAAADQSAADDPFARCSAERHREVDRMVAEGVIEQALVELLKSRAEAMCRASLAELPGDGAPPLPAQ